MDKHKAFVLLVLFIVSSQLRYASMHDQVHYISLTGFDRAFHENISSFQLSNDQEYQHPSKGNNAFVVLSSRKSCFIHKLFRNQINYRNFIRPRGEYVSIFECIN